MYILYLDRYHLGDPLFLTGFARDVQALDAPCLVVHGAGEAAERALEAQGEIARWEDGVLVAATPEERRLVARAARDLGRRIAYTLSDAGVASVPLEAGGRGLISRSSSGLEVKNVEWLRNLVAQRAVPVVAALVGGEGGGVEEVNGGAVAGALAEALAEKGQNATVIFFSKKPLDSIKKGDLAGLELSLVELPEGALPEPAAVRAALAAGAEVQAVGRSALRSDPIEGTRIAVGETRESP